MSLGSRSIAGHLYLASPFFLNATATPAIYTLSLHDALPICRRLAPETRKTGSDDVIEVIENQCRRMKRLVEEPVLDRKSTRLNSSHANISYAVFCLKKKKQQRFTRPQK